MEQAQGLGYSLVDMDNHFYEADDCFSRHIEPAFADQALRLVPGGVGPDGQASDDLRRWAMGSRVMPFLNKNLGDRTRPPGTILGVFEGRISRKDLAVDEDFSPREELPEAFDRAARLKKLDEQGIQACLMLPSHAVVFEEDSLDHQEAWLANVRSFNRWVEEEWGFGTDGRIFGAPMISLLDVDEAVRELERVVARGAKAFYFKTGTHNGYSPADERFDPFWSRVNEMGVRPVLHIDNHGYDKVMADGWGMGPIEAYYNRQTAVLKFFCEVWRPVQDTVGALVLQNLFGRFPNIKMMIIESGSDWIVPALHQMDKAARGSMVGDWAAGQGRIDDKLPSDVFKEHFWVSPFPEDDIPQLVRNLGADAVLFGSDWPHSEGEETPLDYLRHLEGLSDDEVRKIMRNNGAQALGL